MPNSHISYTMGPELYTKGQTQHSSADMRDLEESSWGERKMVHFLSLGLVLNGTEFWLEKRRNGGEQLGTALQGMTALSATRL